MKSTIRILAESIFIISILTSGTSMPTTTTLEPGQNEEFSDSTSTYTTTIIQPIDSKNNESQQVSQNLRNDNAIDEDQIEQQTVYYESTGQGEKQEETSTVIFDESIINQEIMFESTTPSILSLARQDSQEESQEIHSTSALPIDVMSTTQIISIETTTMPNVDNVISEQVPLSNMSNQSRLMYENDVTEQSVFETTTELVTNAHNNEDIELTTIITTSSTTEIIISQAQEDVLNELQNLWQISENLNESQLKNSLSSVVHLAYARIHTEPTDTLHRLKYLLQKLRARLLERNTSSNDSNNDQSSTTMEKIQSNDSVDNVADTFTTLVPEIIQNSNMKDGKNTKSFRRKRSILQKEENRLQKIEENDKNAVDDEAKGYLYGTGEFSNLVFSDGDNSIEHIFNTVSYPKPFPALKIPQIETTIQKVILVKDPSSKVGPQISTTSTTTTTTTTERPVSPWPEALTTINIVENLDSNKYEESNYFPGPTSVTAEQIAQAILQLLTPALKNTSDFLPPLSGPDFFDLTETTTERDYSHKLSLIRNTTNIKNSTTPKPTKIEAVITDLTSNDFMMGPTKFLNGTKEGIIAFAQTFNTLNSSTKMILLFILSVSILSIKLGFYSLGPPIIAIGSVGVVIPIVLLVLLQTGARGVRKKDADTMSNILDEELNDMLRILFRAVEKYRDKEEEEEENI